MAQIFHPSMRVVSRASIIASLIVLGFMGWVGWDWYRSGYFTGVNVPVEQPIPFSHEHHVNGLGISCGYCHTSAEKAAFAGIPPTHTCMTCHSQIWTGAPMLEPVRASYRTQQPLEWVRVHDLPDFAYFNHSIHVNKGMACQVCHGDVNAMPLTWKSSTLQMAWCLDCHRAPEKYIRPVEEIYNFDYKPPVDQIAFGKELVKKYNVQVKQLTDCSICHR
ncbi:MAG: cytochrome c3 family protein [Bacteroidetes bacterium]|nr:cytochrome c3 family protein [Bacteroidota bacterium]MCW5897350.1 cytochrome c3 family protein [Bacteroidota bacterium]